MNKITVSAVKSRAFPGHYQGLITVSLDNMRPYKVLCDCIRLTKSDAISDAAFLSEDYQIPAHLHTPTGA